MPPLKSFKELANDSGSCWQGSAGTGVTAGCRDSLVGLHACSSAASTCGLFLPCKSKKITKTFFRVRFLWQFFFFLLKYFYMCSLTWHRLRSWFLFGMKSPRGSNPERNKKQGGRYLCCLGHGVNSRKLALLQLVFTSPILPSSFPPWAVGQAKDQILFFKT